MCAGNLPQQRSPGASLNLLGPCPLLQVTEADVLLGMIADTLQNITLSVARVDNVTLVSAQTHKGARFVCQEGGCTWPVALRTLLLLFFPGICLYLIRFLA